MPVNLVSQAENPLHLQQLQMQEIEREMRRQREQMASGVCPDLCGGKKSSETCGCRESEKGVES